MVEINIGISRANGLHVVNGNRYQQWVEDLMLLAVLDTRKESCSQADTPAGKCGRDGGRGTVTERICHSPTESPVYAARVRRWPCASRTLEIRSMGFMQAPCAAGSEIALMSRPCRLDVKRYQPHCRTLLRVLTPDQLRRKTAAL